MSNFVCGPGTMDLNPPKDNKGGPGDYNGENGHNLPARTPTPNGVPEQFITRIPGANPGTKAGG